jgi:MFS transporter, FHS family, L-fucose permease
MTNSKTLYGKIPVVLMTFIVMGFVDIIGTATNYVQKDFLLTDFLAQFLPMMVLLWFFILAVPAGVLQDKYGKRFMMVVGMTIQAVGLGLPFVHYSFPMMFASFILLGIGNTIIQVSSNPLLQDVTSKTSLPSYLSFSQFVKAIISFLGPILTAQFATHFGNWKLVLAVYGLTSLLAAIWLSLTPITESKPERKPATFASCIGLLKNRFMAFMALSIFLIVGIEVGLNTNIANILIAKYGITIEKAVLAISFFFAGETISRLFGAIILNWVRPRVFLFMIVILSLFGVAGVFVSPNLTMAYIAILVIGLGLGNMFPVIFSFALEKMPDRANEVSGLLIMAVSGGAVVPLIIGLVSTLAGPPMSILVVGACLFYLLWVSIYVRKN